MHPDAEGAYTAKPVRCHACAEQAKTAKAWSEGKGESAGLYFGVRKNT